MRITTNKDAVILVFAVRYYPRGEFFNTDMIYRKAYPNFTDAQVAMREDLFKLKQAVDKRDRDDDGESSIIICNTIVRPETIHSASLWIEDVDGNCIEEPFLEEGDQK